MPRKPRARGPPLGLCESVFPLYPLNWWKHSHCSPFVLVVLFCFVFLKPPVDLSCFPLSSLAFLHSFGLFLLASFCFASLTAARCDKWLQPLPFGLVQSYFNLIAEVLTLSPLALGLCSPALPIFSSLSSYCWARLFSKGIIVSFILLIIFPDLHCKLLEGQRKE